MTAFCFSHIKTIEKGLTLATHVGRFYVQIDLQGD